jgi:hypothetical protein
MSARSLLVALLALAGCRSATCKSGTILLTVTFEGDAANADRIDVTVAVDGTTLRSEGGHVPQIASGTLELDFMNGYPKAQTISITLTAFDHGRQVGEGHADNVALTAGCTALALDVRALDGGSDASVADLSGEDLSGEDLSGEDLSGVDLGAVDLAGADLVCTPSVVALSGAPADVLIVLDRSGSMSDPPPAGGASKWQQVTQAIDATLAANGKSLGWGLEIFPSDGNCAAGTNIDVPVGMSTTGAIANAMSAMAPIGSTPTTDAIHGGGRYLSGLADGLPKYLLLATDGQPNCGVLIGNDDTVNAVNAVRDEANAGVYTFVVGIAADAMSDQALTMMSANGNEAKTGAQNYYSIMTQADFQNAMNAIITRLTSCTLSMPQAPTNHTFNGVFVNGSPVAHDPSHKNGWDTTTDGKIITIYGPACDSLISPTAMQASAIFQCSP